MTTKNRRTFGVIAGAVGFAMLLGSCATTSTPEESAGPLEADLRIVWWGSDQRTAATKQALEIIEGEYPGITITGEGSSYEGYFEKFATQLAGGNAPDIIQQNLIGPLQQFSTQGALLPLDEYFGKELDVSGFEKFIEYGRVGDATYGIPLTQTTFGTIYNPDKFAELGVDVPEFGWTWDDFESTCEDIVAAAAGSIACSVDGSFEVFNYEIWHYGRTGKNIYDENGQRQDTPELMTEWFEMWQDFRDKGLIVPADVQAAHRVGDTPTSPYVLGRAVVTFDYSTNFPAYTPLTGSVAAMTTSPSSGKNPNNYITPTSLWSINADSKNPEESLVVINELINNPEIQGVLGMTRGLPINPVALEIVTPDLDESGKVVADFIAELSASDQLRLLQTDLPAGAVDIEDLYRRTAEDIAFGRVTPEEGAKAFFEQAKRFL